jgi:outer membrane protein assembly factor BamD
LNVRPFFFAVLLGALSVVGCGGSDQSTRGASMTTETRFDDGMAAYNKGDWVEAIKIFDEVRIQAPTSDLAQRATYYQALSRYNAEMYSGAAVDFRALRRNYPGSPFIPRAQYMIGESYFKISPRPELDQSYSILALGEFQNFLREFPTAEQSLKDSAEQRIAELRDRLARKVFLSAELYVKMHDNKSAIVYYQRVLDNYYDSKYAPESQLRVAELQYERNKIAEAQSALGNFEDKYLKQAEPDLRRRALELRNRLPRS